MGAKDWLSKRWMKAGIKNDDTVLLHSNIVRTLAQLRREGFKPSAEVVLDSFISALGDQGTLVIPLFNFDFTSGVKFDFRYTESHMGALTEAARKNPEAVRTGHPIYSFCAIGRQSHVFKGVDNYSGYGADSPFGLIRQLNGKIAVLDIEENRSMTFHHHVEEMMSVPYRYSKEFRGKYIDINGIESERSYAIYVRNLEQKVETCLNPIGEKLLAANIYKGDKPNDGTGLRIGNANEIFTFVEKIISNGDALGNLYKIGK